MKNEFHEIVIEFWWIAADGNRKQVLVVRCLRWRARPATTTRRSCRIRGIPDSVTTVRRSSSCSQWPPRRQGRCQPPATTTTTTTTAWQPEATTRRTMNPTRQDWSSEMSSSIPIRYLDEIQLLLNSIEWFHLLLLFMVKNPRKYLFHWLMTPKIDWKLVRNP